MPFNPRFLASSTAASTSSALPLTKAKTSALGRPGSLFKSFVVLKCAPPVGWTLKTVLPQSINWSMISSASSGSPTTAQTRMVMRPFCESRRLARGLSSSCGGLAAFFGVAASASRAAAARKLSSSASFWRSADLPPQPLGFGSSSSESPPAAAASSAAKMRAMRSSSIDFGLVGEGLAGSSAFFDGGSFQLLDFHFSAGGSAAAGVGAAEGVEGPFQLKAPADDGGAAGLSRAGGSKDFPPEALLPPPWTGFSLAALLKFVAAGAACAGAAAAFAGAAAAFAGAAAAFAGAVAALAFGGKAACLAAGGKALTGDASVMLSTFSRFADFKASVRAVPCLSGMNTRYRSVSRRNSSTKPKRPFSSGFDSRLWILTIFSISFGFRMLKLVCLILRSTSKPPGLIILIR
mmetsp:Transcript_97016/g.216386  ORF Transcript_97016/g.216386 Transcript_97016/m.216386 type:complete len:406 (-) Transcript_97016:855-2072(-)